jgi:hypothetical protein
MVVRGPSDSGGRQLDGNMLYVDGDTSVTNGNGGDESPFATITLALAAAAAGDEILIRPAAAGYVEDLTLVDGVSLTGIGDELIVVTGTATATDVGCTIEGLSFVDDGAGSALDIAGTAAETLRLLDCLFTSTAGGDQVCTMLNTAQIVFAENCRFVANVANANEAVLIGQGTVTFDNCYLTHGLNTVDALLCSGAAAATVNLNDCNITGSVESAAAAVAPVVTVRGGQIVVGAVSAGIIAATCTQEWSGTHVTSADAGNFAFDGAGNLTRANIAYGGTASAANVATLTVVDEVSDDQKLKIAGVWYVDGAFTGTELYGSQALPYNTVAAAIAAAAAGDVIYVAAGAYTEDLAIAADVDLIGMCGPLSGAVTVTGTCTITDASCSITNMGFIDDTAGGALHITGTGADEVVLSGCIVAATATGDYALEHDNTNATLTAFGSRFTTAGASANPCVIIESGTVDMNGCDVLHNLNTSQAIELQGDAATTFTFRNGRVQGSIDSEATAVAPACDLDNVRVTVGAAAALNIAATTTQVCNNVVINSTEAAQDAVLGAGAITLMNGITFMGTANEIGGTVTPARLVRSNVQSGTYVEAAGAGTRAITFPEVARDAPDVITVTYIDTGGGAYALTDEIDTVAATGFNITTPGNGSFMWSAFWLL